MLQRLREAGLLWSTLATIVAFAILASLGAWQWKRMHWKRGLLDRLEAAATAAPVALERAVKAAADTPLGFPEALQYRRVEVHGTFDHANEFHVWAPARRGPAWQVVTPLSLAEPVANPKGAPARFTHVMVIRGIVPEARKSPQSRAGGQVSGLLAFEGRIRLDAPNPSAPDPNVVKNQWYTRDLARMTVEVARAGRGGASETAFTPFFIEAADRTGPQGAPEPDLAKLTLSNRHFEYALTWWGLAATLIGVCVAFAATRLRGNR
jgi:surfeit locus 1 family protein